MGDRVAVDRAIGMGWQVHSRDYVLWEYPSGSGTQWDVFGLDDGFESPLDLLERFINRHQRAAMGETIVAQLVHRGRPS
jgi:hypothetical protein